MTLYALTSDYNHVQEHHLTSEKPTRPIAQPHWPNGGPSLGSLRAG